MSFLQCSESVVADSLSDMEGALSSLYKVPNYHFRLQNSGQKHHCSLHAEESSLECLFLRCDRYF